MAHSFGHWNFPVVWVDRPPTFLIIQFQMDIDGASNLISA
ncbi:hypothetical protein LINGRAHAP2_LOCUS4208 [Linum grandiflorum]